MRWGFESLLRYCGVGESGCPRQSHKLKIVGSNPTTATDQEAVGMAVTLSR